ncbi:hypothetical protein CLG96_02980 [Sphingomonas oleivorans]|uniref:Porin n=1 Tax=Sphingomonas oleivorans TaxID=1735121 RepID=A0A2T5G1S2_9SPHN|nr:porin [Sphingomonas oleivorans]PTQ13109.1 hypothetical protein CLG96_02980 [Sphingomonas oleivorans]
MTIGKLLAAPAAATALLTAPVFAQAPQPAAATGAEGSEARIAALQAQMEALQAQLDALKKQMTVVTPSWKGAPEFSGEGGFKFRVRGFAQFDAGYVDTPGATRAGTVGGLNYNNLGWNTRGRRFVFGAEGTVPGGFGYKAEFNFAQGSVGYEDVVLTYQPDGSPLLVTVGNFFPLSSLESMTSSRVGSVLERAAVTDAFNYNRRLGVSVGLVDPKDRYTLTAGLFSQEIDDDGQARTGWQASVRGTWSPALGDTRLHLGANFQHRVNPKDAQNARYRSRPFTQLTDQRFVDTGAIAAKGDDVVGIELAAIHGPFHFAGEAQKLWVDGHRPGALFGPNNGVAGATFYAGNPSFETAYGEIGFFLTGESRGYKGGRWERAKVLKPFDKGGIGAIQINGRIDYLNLKDRVATGPLIVAPDYVNGGRQTGYQLSLIWNPIDYVRLMAQYAHSEIDGGPRAATVKPGSTGPANDRGYSFDSLAMRAQVEF